MKTANLGCKLGMAGMAGAVTTTYLGVAPGYAPISAALLGGGGAIGYYVGNSVSPIQLPQTVAAFHSLVGAAAMFASIGSYMAHPEVSR